MGERPKEKGSRHNQSRSEIVVVLSKFIKFCFISKASKSKKMLNVVRFGGFGYKTIVRSNDLLLEKSVRSKIDLNYIPGPLYYYIFINTTWILRLLFSEQTVLTVYEIDLDIKTTCRLRPHCTGPNLRVVFKNRFHCAVLASTTRIDLV